MRNFLFLALLGLVVCVSACKNNSKGITTEHGYGFVNHTNKEGVKAQYGQTIEVLVDTYLGDTLLGSVAKEYGGPRELRLPTQEQLTQNGNEKVPALLEAALLMSEGDSATIYQTLDSMQIASLPKELRESKEVRFEIVLVDIKSDEEIKAAEAEATKAAEAAKAQGIEVAAMVSQTLKDYKANKLGDRLKKTESGLGYVVIQPGTGELKPGDMVPTHYYGILESTGAMFDNSYDHGQAMPFTVGQLVPGFNEGMQVIGRGGKGVLFIPYQLAYGEEARGPIPAKSNLVFYIDLGAEAPGGGGMPAGHSEGDGHNH